MTMIRVAVPQYPSACWGTLRAIFKRMVMTGYNAVVAANGLTRLGCMAHARRKFSDAVKAQGRNRNAARPIGVWP